MTMEFFRRMLRDTSEPIATDGITSTNENKMSPWIQTYSGVAFDLLAPTPEMISIVDIAHSLSRLCRYTGHVISANYSVAEHSILVASLLPPKLKLQGLL